MGKGGTAAHRAVPPYSIPTTPSTRAHSAGRPDLEKAGQGWGGGSMNPSTGANRPTVDGYSKLSRGLARALLALLAVTAGALVGGRP